MEAPAPLSSTDPDFDAAIVVFEALRDADVVHVFGEFSFWTADRIEETLARSVRIAHATVCNLNGCSYLDAAGVGVLARARHALGKAFTIVVPETGITRRVLEVSGLLAG